MPLTPRAARQPPTRPRRAQAGALEALKARGAKVGNRELMLATSECHAEVVRALLASGLNARGSEGDGDAPILVAAAHNCVETVELLLDKGADVNAKDNDGWTPLIKAAAGGRIELARLLLERGADIDVVDKLERTASMYAGPAGARRDGGALQGGEGQKAVTAFRAFRVFDEGGAVGGRVVSATLEELSPGDVVIKAAYSSVNCKRRAGGYGDRQDRPPIPADRRHRRIGHGRIERRRPLRGGRPRARDGLRPRRRARWRIRGTRAGAR